MALVPVWKFHVHNTFTRYTFYSNNIDALIPELWAMESVAILEENMTIGNLIHRDFSDEIAKYGDVVNTRKPTEMTAKRKSVNDDVTIQDAVSTNIPVTLNQLVHTSFLIRDGEQSKAFKDLVAIYLQPAMLAQARFVDKVLLGQLPQFISNGEGHLGNISSTNANSYMLEARKTLNINKAPADNRNLIWTPTAETFALKNDTFINADKVGDGGLALREAYMGRLLGFNNYMCQNAASIGAVDTDGDPLAINNAAGYPRGTTTVTVDSGSTAIPVGAFIKIDGDDTPQRVVSTVGGATPTSITITPGLRNAVVDNAVINVYDECLVNNASGYASGYDGYIAVDNFTIAPQVGQIVSFGLSSTSALYTVVDYTSSTILLDRPLEAALSDNDVINMAPPGEYNFAFHRNCMALVIRPLAAPMAGVGAMSSVVSYNGFAMRAVITYNGTKQGHLVTLDMLMGVAKLENALGVPMYA